MDQKRTSHPRALVAFAALASIVVLMLAGCGKSKDVGPVAGTAASQANYASPPAESASPVPIPGSGESGSAVEGSAAVQADSLAPDLVVTMSDTLGLPGRSVELTARTSPDVVGITLWDGLGQKQAFVHDSTANLWRATYRVPLKAPHGRLGIAVTARNQAGRWHRVWSFLTTAPEAPTTQAAPPTGF